MERDGRESEGAEVCPEGKTSEPGGGDPTAPRLFSELGAGITEVEIPAAGPAGEEADAETDEGAVVPETEEEAVPPPPVLTGRRKGGPFRRVLKVEAQADVEGVALSGEQRLLILDA